MEPWIVATAGATLAHLVFDASRHTVGKSLAKALASGGFVGTAIAAGALETAYGRFVAVALALSLVGDLCLVAPRAGRAFFAGLAAFILAHVAYAAAFAVRGVEVPWSLGAMVVLALPAAGVLRWLSGRVPPRLAAAVIVYAALLTLMLALAAGAWAAGAPPTVLAGAFLFYVSDLSVARDRFVSGGFANRLWGIPVYYAGQILLAASVAGA